MALSPLLLEILICPVCRARLVLKDDQSALKCTECKRVYAIRDDVPNMKVDQSIVEA